ncbi:LpqB family beta-propeller domain-containing protein [Lapillicoccus jejuensis]|uniref:Lipoprotein LpqB-like beta-propeller protein n=1 Tax=Lapillicoccus jejuensis TaxID=402171 RepID=A0A542E2I0_9MICO|nr:LpqB family beta-propeller domain-containing protein [Lapillicoccus jejuensis]TQJ09543.1 lipoprotein LpqB-like beta-propeller protein [Lapillicoccus jejuensis]
MNPRRRGGRVLVLALLAALLLGGCGGLPGSSPVAAGLRADTKVDQRARVVVSGPIKGAPQTIIARDFIRAGAAFQDTDANQQVVGRTFLAPDSVDRWKPTSAITVYDAPTSLTIDQLPSDQVRVSVAAVATIDAAGRYAELPPGTTRSLVLSMVRVDGEWRIELPAAGFGLWLNTDDLEQVMGHYELHYVVAGTQRLVSDVRWFPSGSGLATALTRAQLGPVPGYLSGVATTAFPASAQLAVDAVDVDPQGKATVVLADDPAVVEPGRRRALWAQLVATLLQPGTTVISVALEVQGVGPIPVPNVADEVAQLDVLGFTTEPSLALTVGAARRGTEVTLVNPQDVAEGGVVPAGRPLQGAPGPTRVSSAYTGLALSPDGTDLAAVAQGRAELVRWRAGVPLTAPPLGTDLTDPAYDTAGRLWVAGSAQGRTTVWTLTGTAATPGVATPVSAGWLTGRRVLSLRISPDATRAAVVSTAADGSGSRLDVSGVRRDGSGVPLSLAAPYQQGQPLVDLRTATWVGPLELVALARDRAGGQLRPFDVSLGAGVGLRRVARLTLDQQLVPPVPDAVSVQTRDVDSPAAALVVLTGEATYLRLGGRWELAAGVRDLVVGGL